VLDYSEWLTPERLGVEESAWAGAGLHLTYVAHISLLRSKFPIYSILEMGCGTGWVPSQLTPDVKYVGIDKNHKALELATKKNLISRSFVDSDIRHFDSKESADLVCSFAVLKHFSLEEWDYIFDKMVRFAPIGLFTMSVANENRDDGTEFHHTYITPERLAQALERNRKKLLYKTVSWQGLTWEQKQGEEWIFAVVPKETK
jgi:trans-aconitate methyltransferase